MTEGEPTTSVPLTWEKAFGGMRPTAAGRQIPHEANPVGLGLLHEDLSSKDQLIPAPQIEAQAYPITDWRKDYDPEGLAPVAPWWSARGRHSGTYDEAWRQTRPPLPPLDFKYDFWQAAPAGQCFRPWLFGNETICLSGLLATAPNLEFALPLQKILCLVKYRDNVFIKNIMFLDGVHVDLNSSDFTVRLSWRASFPLTTNVVSATVATLEGRETNPGRLTQRSKKIKERIKPSKIRNAF